MGMGCRRVLRREACGSPISGGVAQDKQCGGKGRGGSTTLTCCDDSQPRSPRGRRLPTVCPPGPVTGLPYRRCCCCCCCCRRAAAMSTMITFAANNEFFRKRKRNGPRCSSPPARLLTGLHRRPPRMRLVQETTGKCPPHPQPHPHASTVALSNRPVEAMQPYLRRRRRCRKLYQKRTVRQPCSPGTSSIHGQLS